MNQDRKTIVCRDLAGHFPEHYLTVPKNFPTHKAVEKFQRNLAKLGYPTGVTYRVVDCGLIDAMIEVNHA